MLRGYLVISTSMAERNFWCNFKMSVEINGAFNWFCIASLYDWSVRLVPPSQPIKCKTKTTRN